MGHAESASGPQLIKRIGTWIRRSVGLEPDLRNTLETIQ
jgi:hypothetical protein